MRVSYCDIVLYFCYYNHDILLIFLDKDDSSPTISEAAAAGPDVIVGIRSLCRYS